jgi:hypothetical protein
METTGEPTGIWIPYQSLVWSLHDILLMILFWSLLQLVLEDCITVQCLRAAPERCKDHEKLSLPRDAVGHWKSISCWTVLYKCWQIESTWLSASDTIFTIPNTIIIAIITMEITPLTSSLLALDSMCTLTPTICRLQGADFAKTSES